MNLSRRASRRDLKRNVFSRHDAILRKYAYSRLVSQHRQIVLTAQMSQCELVSPVSDQFGRERSRIVIGQMTTSAFDPLLQIKRIRAGFQHADIVVRFEINQIASRKILSEIVRDETSIRRNADPVMTVCQAETDRVRRIMRGFESQALHLAQRTRYPVFKDDPVFRGNLSDLVSDFFPRIKIGVDRYMVAPGKNSGAGNMVAVLMSDQDPVQIMRILSDFEKLFFDLLSVFPGPRW